MQYICSNAEDCTTRLNNLDGSGKPISMLEDCQHRVPHSHALQCDCTMCGKKVGSCVEYVVESPIKIEIIEVEKEAAE